MATSLFYEPRVPQISPLRYQPTRHAPADAYTSPIERKTIGQKHSMRTRIAELHDAKAIHQLIESFTRDGTLLRRSYLEICENISTFTIAETKTNEFLGCAALHIYGPHLAEIRSIVVRPGAAGNGAGSLLVQSLLTQAEQANIKCVCLFTRIPAFFSRFHFHVAERHLLQDKIRKDCQHCARRNACDETAMVIGEVPTHHSMPFTQSRHRLPGDLVQLQL